MVNAPLLFQKNWPQFYKNGAAVEADYVVVSKGFFDPSSEEQPESEVYRKTIYPVIAKDKKRYSDNDPLPSSRGGGSTLSGTTVSFPVLDLDVIPEKGHIIEVLLSGKKFKVEGKEIDPTGSVYTLEVVNIG